MRTRVLLFAAAKEAAGADHVDVELPPGARVADARAALARQVRGLQTLAGKSVFAINEAYAPDEAVIAPGVELALIPPVSGG